MLESDPNDVMPLSRRVEFNKQAGNQGAALADAGKVLAIEPRHMALSCGFQKTCSVANVYRDVCYQ